MDGDIRHLAAFCYPRLAPRLAALAAPWVAVVAEGEDGAPLGLALGVARPRATGTLYSVMAARGHRRRGIGQALLLGWEAAARGVGAVSLEARWPSRLLQRVALEATLRRAGWTMPERVTLVRWSRSGTVAEAVATWPEWAGLRRLRRTPGLCFAPWGAADATEAAPLLAPGPNQARMPSGAPAVPRDLAAVDPDLSISVRWHGRLVGWQLTGPVPAGVVPPDPAVPAIWYDSAWLEPALMRRGFLICAYHEGHTRVAAIHGAAALVGYMSDQPRMVSMSERRFTRMALAEEHVLRAKKTLD